MTRAEAIDTIEKAAADRLARMFNMLADAYEGSRTQKEQAHGNFERGLPMLQDAKNAAFEMIDKAFPET